jgi:hypothetical protein
MSIPFAADNTDLLADPRLSARFSEQSTPKRSPSLTHPANENSITESNTRNAEKEDPSPCPTSAERPVSGLDGSRPLKPRYRNCLTGRYYDDEPDGTSRYTGLKGIC